MKKLFRTEIILSLFAAFGFTACQQPTTTTTVNTNTVTTTTTNSIGNTNSATSAANTNSAVSTTNAVEANEPDKYQGTVTLKLAAGGNDKKTTLPAISAVVARSGDNRRMEFTLPNGEKVVYLDLGGKQFIVSPNRKQYGELNKESLGIDIRRLLTPSQIIAQVKSMKGVERVGEEKYNGRDAIKYQYKAVTDTKTQAGSVDTSSVIYVDKETGLPLHSETDSASQTNSVNGINNMSFVTEMTNLQTTADPALFAEPTDFQKVEPDQIRKQLEVVFNVIGTFVGQAMQSAQNSSASNSNAAPAASPTASPK